MFAVTVTDVFTPYDLLCCSRAGTDDSDRVWYRSLHGQSVDAEPRPQLPVVVVRPRCGLGILLRLCEHRSRQLHTHHSTRVPRTRRQDAADRHERFGAVVRREVR